MHCRNTVAYDVSGDNGKKNYLVTKMDRYNKCQTKQYTRTHAHTHCTHISWWSVLGWVTTKEDHPLLWFDAQSIEIWSVNKYYIISYQIMLVVTHIKVASDWLMSTKGRISCRYCWAIAWHFDGHYFIDDSKVRNHRHFITVWCVWEVQLVCVSQFSFLIILLKIIQFLQYICNRCIDFVTYIYISDIST